MLAMLMGVGVAEILFFESLISKVAWSPHIGVAAHYIYIYNHVHL